METPAARPALPVAQSRAQALTERVLALAGNAPAPREPEPDTGERNTGDGSHEQAVHLATTILGASLERDLRQTEAGWVDRRTGELVP